MKVAVNDNTVSNSFAGSGMQINITPKIYEMLSSGVYKDNIAAIIREPATNAWDSHIEAGTTDVPFEVYLPTKLDPVYRLYDYGTGVAPEDIHKVFTFGLSGKDHSDEFNGALGIGAKSPFSYADSFTVKTRWNGTEYTFLAFKTQGMPQLSESPVASVPTDKANGLSIEIPIEVNDFYEVRDTAITIFSHFDMDIPFKLFYGDEDIAQTIKDKHYQNSPLKTDNLYIDPGSSKWGSPSIKAVMANVAYDVDTNRIAKDIRAMINSEFNGATIYVQAPNGSFMFTNGREEIDYSNDKSKTFLTVDLPRMLMEWATFAKPMYDNAKNNFERGRVRTYLKELNIDTYDNTALHYKHQWEQESLRFPNSFYRDAKGELQIAGEGVRLCNNYYKRRYQRKWDIEKVQKTTGALYLRYTDEVQHIVLSSKKAVKKDDVRLFWDTDLTGDNGFTLLFMHESKAPALRRLLRMHGFTNVQVHVISDYKVKKPRVKRDTPKFHGYWSKTNLVMDQDKFEEGGLYVKTVHRSIDVSCIDNSRELRNYLKGNPDIYVVPSSASKKFDKADNWTEITEEYLRKNYDNTILDDIINEKAKTLATSLCGKYRKQLPALIRGAVNSHLGGKYVSNYKPIKSLEYFTRSPSEIKHFCYAIGTNKKRLDAKAQIKAKRILKQYKADCEKVLETMDMPSSALLSLLESNKSDPELFKMTVRRIYNDINT